jgi:hypothetical protein
MTAEYVQGQTQYFPDPEFKGQVPPTPACSVTW